MRAVTRKILLAVTMGVGLLGKRCDAQVTLAWNTNSDPTILGYYLVWGTNSGNYIATNVYPPTQGSDVIQGLQPGQIYYFNIAAFTSNGPSPYQGELVYTNSAPATNVLSPPVTATGSPTPPTTTNTPPAPVVTNSPVTTTNGTVANAPTNSSTGATNTTSGTTQNSDTNQVAGTNTDQDQVTLAWNTNSDPTILGYYVVWGMSSGNYTLSNTYSATQSSGTVQGLQPGQVYYFNIAAFTSNGVTPFQGEVVYSNSAATVIAPPPVTIVTAPFAPPTPPTTPPAPPVLTNSPVVTTNGSVANGSTNSANGSTNQTSNTSQNSNTNQAPNTNIVQSIFWGVPPFLTFVMSNGQPNLNLGGTVGATITIQSGSDLTSFSGWSDVTNLSISNTAPVALTNPPSQTPDALDLAFVPGLETVPVAATNSGLQFFRVVMPYDYVILASMVLPQKNYTPRLIVVNMPGVVCDDACYVNESSSFIHFDRSTYALQLQGSGSTIRQIASQLASSLNLDWTSASEFTYSNGLGQILATVVETEPPSSDPVAGQAPPSSPIVINF